jgi:heterogeneous nuclear ribonucleoprotein L
MIYELDPVRFNCMRLFNLVCLFGNPLKVKMLVKKPGTAMIEFSDPRVAAEALKFIKELEIFSSKIEVGMSRSSTISAPRNPANVELLADGTPAFMDFSRQPLLKMWRFPNTFEGASKARKPVPPTKCLHYFNAPKDSSTATIFAVFEKAGVEKPVAHEKFPDDEGKHTDRGLLEFATVKAATEAVTFCNHVQMPKPTGGVNTLKLAFSPREILGGGGESGGGGTAMAIAADAGAVTDAKAAAEPGTDIATA